MAKFTVQIEYLLPVYLNVNVEAATAKEAAEIALQTDNWDGAEQSFDGCSDTYVASIWSGFDAAFSGEEIAIPAGVPKATATPLISK